MGESTQSVCHTLNLKLILKTLNYLYTHQLTNQYLIIRENKKKDNAFIKYLLSLFENEPALSTDVAMTRRAIVRYRTAALWNSYQLFVY